MSTRSTINLAVGNNKFKSSYCQFDGYLSNNGKVLLEYYTTYDLINDLLDNDDGPIRCLEKTKQKTNYYHDNEMIPAKVLLNDVNFQEYNYFFLKDSNWYLYENDKFKRLTVKMCQEDD